MIDLDKIQKPILIAHRGCRNKYPENTLSAFRAALQKKARMIELDVALSRDNSLVVIHDDTVDRTTDGNGNVREFTLPELKEMDAGNWFAGEFKNERLPELREVFDLVKHSALINVEIKNNYFDEVPGPDSIENQVINLVRETNMMDHVLISSFERRYLLRLKDIKDTPSLAFISESPADRETLDLLYRINAYSWHPWHEILTKDQVDLMHDNGFRVFAFTVNTIEDYWRMAEMDVDGVFTDDLDLLSQQEKEKNNPQKNIKIHCN